MVCTEIIALALVLLLGYVYFGYPALLWLVSTLFGSGHRFDPRHEPTVTLVISAYNEREVIGSKLENSLQLEYPQGKLDILVVSDCSTDGTDQVVAGFADRGVRLYRAAARLGKTAALNEALETVDSEIVVFSDANAIYDAGAIRFLVGHFVDDCVGYAVGHARYHEERRTAAGESEGIYWNIEVMIKQWESRFSSVVGGDGAIYAIRRALYEPMQETDINDLVNPLQIVAKGYRGVFDPRAWCVEHPAGEFGKEFYRKVRIANRSFNAVLRVPQTLNPLRVGFFAWQLVSHKVLRWFSPFLLGGLVLDMAVDRMLKPVNLFDQLWAILLCFVAALAAVGWAANGKSRHPLWTFPYYFVLMNLASAKGIMLRLRGRTISTWSTVRDAAPAQAAAPVTGRLLLFGLLLSGLLAATLIAGGRTAMAASIILLALLAHAYLLYPLLLRGLAPLAARKVAADDRYLPEVTLLIVAYNEERDIEQKLNNSLLLDYPPGKLRIVVASDGSRDATNSIVSSYLDQGIELIAFEKNRGKIAALNDAMAGISSEIVVLSDANVDYDTTAVRRLVRHFSDQRVGAVSGKVVLLNDALSYRDAENGYYGIEHYIQEREGALGTLIGTDGAMYAIRRSLFRPPPPDTILDDLVIAMSIARSGHLVLHDKEAVGFEVNRLELADEFRRKARIIAGGYQCLLRPGVLPAVGQPLLLFCFISHKVLRWLSGIMVLSLFCLLGEIGLTGQGWEQLFFTVVLAALTAALLLALLVQALPVLKKARVALFCHYFFVLMAASLVGCYLGLTRRQKVAWRSS
jgi:cellulose synthase/poly-beta-1,6-N-acetylglucosamine synthase-like glycosyltransferase